jgi:hypothetical protein
MGIEERLLAHPVARQEQTLVVPDRQREHPVEALETLRSPLQVGAQRDFRVGGRLEAPALGFELAA